MAQQPHQRIINESARANLKPIGLIQKGRSRTWLDDHGWWTTVVEYQPSGFGKGTYLNVGVNLHWYPRNYFSFDIGSRVGGFVAYSGDTQFAEAMKETSALAT